METELITATAGLVLGILGAYVKTRKYRRILAAVIRGVNAAVNYGEEKHVKQHIRRASLEEDLQTPLHHEVRRVEAGGK